MGWGVGGHDSVQAFDSILSSTLVLVGSSYSHILLWATSHISTGVTHMHTHIPTHTHTYQKVHNHEGICVTGYTHFSSAGARACCQFGEKRRRAPGVWPLLPLSCSGFSSILLSSLSHSFALSRCCFLRHHFSHRFFHTSTTSPWLNCLLKMKLRWHATWWAMAFRPAFCFINPLGYF